MRGLTALLVGSWTIIVATSTCFALESTEVTLPGSPPSYSSPVIADVASSPGLEVVAVGNDGKVHVVSLETKTLLWSREIPKAGCSGGVNSSPAVGALFGDGTQYILVGYGSLGARGCDGGVVAMHGETGDVRWQFSTKEFSKKKRFWQFRSSVFATPTLADLDCDGKLEVIFGSFDRHIYILEAIGKVRRYLQAADTVFSSVGVGDLKGGSCRSAIAGSDISGNKRLKPITRDGGNVMAITGKKGKEELATFRSKRHLLWLRPLDQVIQSSIAIGDVTTSNRGKEIVVGTGCFFPQNTNNKRGRWVQVLSQATGKPITRFGISACSSASPALGDLDGDGIDDIVTISRGESYIGGDGSSHVYGFSAQKKATLWDVIPRAGGSNDEGAGDFSSPVIADVDGNGSPEVLLNFSNEVVILSGSNGQSLTCDVAKCDDGRPRLRTGGSMRNTPAVSNGTIVAFGARGGKGTLFFWRLDGPAVSSVGTRAAYYSPWPQFRANPNRSGAN